MPAVEDMLEDCGCDCRPAIETVKADQLSNKEGVGLQDTVVIATRSSVAD